MFAPVTPSASSSSPVRTVRAVGKPARSTADKSLSCAECRRLKLKCDRQRWPCETCVRRGLQSLCPDGTLEKGKGKMQSANTGDAIATSLDARHAASSDLLTPLTNFKDSSRIASRLDELERKLDLLLDASLRSQGHPNGPLHELASVATNHFALESSRGDETDQPVEAAQQHNGTLKLRADGQVHYVGSNAHSMYLADEEQNGVVDSRRVSFRDNLVSRPGSPTPIDFEAAQELPGQPTANRAASPAPEGSTPSTIESQPSHLIWATPGFRSPHSSTAIWNYLKAVMPAEKTAVRMINVYYASVTFMFHPIERDDFDKNIWNIFYGDHSMDARNISRSAVAPSGFHPHKLALLYSMLSLGVLLDVRRPQRDATGRALYSCAWNALALSNFTESPSLQSILALMHIILYLTWRRGGKYAESAYPLLGTMMRMAISSGLHRDPALFHLDEEERERRRLVFWEAQSIEVFRALAFCRPPALSDRHVDALLPRQWRHAYDESDVLRLPSNMPSSAAQCEGVFHSFKSRQVRMINRMLDECLCAKSAYQTTMHFNRQLKAMLGTIPDWMMPSLVESVDESKGSLDELEQTYDDLVLRHAMVLEMQRHITLLNQHQAILLLHRGWFAQALQYEGQARRSSSSSRIAGISPNADELASSVAAVNESASTMIAIVISAYCKYPALVIRWAFFWNAIFSAAVCRGLFAIKKRRSATEAIAHAWNDLRKAIELFKQAVVGWAPLESPLEILERLAKRTETEEPSNSGTGVMRPFASEGLGHDSQPVVEDLSLIGQHGQRQHRRQSKRGKEVGDGMPSSSKRARSSQMMEDSSIHAPDVCLPLDHQISRVVPDMLGLATSMGGSDMDLLPLSEHPAALPAFFSSADFDAAAPTAAAFNDGDEMHGSMGGNTANATHLIQMLSSGLTWDDVTSWNELIIDL